MTIFTKIEARRIPRPLLRASRAVHGPVRAAQILILSATVALFPLQSLATAQTSPSPQPWGGYAVPPAIPYQPTLTDPSCGQPAVMYPSTGVPVYPSSSGAVAGGPVVIVDAPPPVGYSIPGQITPVAQTLVGQVVLPPVPNIDPATGQAWQTYPVPGGVVPAAANPAFPAQDPIYPTTPELSDPKSLIPPGSRDGVFQKVNLDATYLPQLENDSLGWTDLRADIVFGLPFFTRETPIVITPSYGLHLLDRPEGLDLPPRLNDVAIDFHHFRRVSENWIADIAVTPGLYADDHSFDRSDAVRITGRGLAIYESSPFTKWVMGVAYLDGAGWEIIPVGGVVYEPNDDVSYELVFPQPKISWRLPSSPVPGIDERWFYIGAEFGSGIWAIEYSNGAPDVFVSRDYRVLVGYERKIIGGLSRRVEFGYVFGREIEFDSSPSEIKLDDTVMVRAGLTY